MSHLLRPKRKRLGGAPVDETPGCASAWWDGTRRLGGGVSCRVWTTPLLLEKSGEPVVQGAVGLVRRASRHQGACGVWTTPRGHGRRHAGAGRRPSAPHKASSVHCWTRTTAGARVVSSRVHARGCADPGWDPAWEAWRATRGERSRGQVASLTVLVGSSHAERYPLLCLILRVLSPEGRYRRPVIPAPRPPRAACEAAPASWGGMAGTALALRVWLAWGSVCAQQCFRAPGGARRPRLCYADA
jgi:hypothetical protein